MSVQQPPVPAGPAAPVSTTPTPPPAKKSGCAGCSVGCLGCLGVVVLVVLLLLGSGYFFLIAQAQAGVASQAALLVVTTPVDVGKNDGDYKPGFSGQLLDAGASIRTGDTGHATVQFPDGTLVRMAPSTTITIQSAQLNSTGTLKSATIQQKLGRTIASVQKLVGGSSFSVGGHSVSAEVRGTEFETFVREDGSNQIKVFDGSVKVSGQTTTTLNAGQQIDVDRNGKLGQPSSIQSDKTDPFALVRQCERAVALGTSPGTLQTTTGDNLSTGQTAEVDYRSSGGTVSVALCYPGSFMNLSITDPNGIVHSLRSGQPPVEGNVNGPPGIFKAIVHAIDVPGGEPFVVTFATNAACVEGNIDSGGIVRQTLSNAQLQQSMADSGASGIHIEVEGVSSSSARIHYFSDIAGNELSWTIAFYAATPNLGALLTEVSFHNINLTAKVMDRITEAGKSISSIPQGYVVDRVYSCVGPGGNMMVIEGHR